jgi:hypothetical protein
MSPARMSGNTMFVAQIIFFSFRDFIKHFVGNPLQTVLICHQDGNIFKYITCTHYTWNREDNHEILLWCGNPNHNIYKDHYLL